MGEKIIVDISEHNGIIDFDEMAKKVDGVMVRLSVGFNGENVYREDKRARTYIHELNKRGVPWGVYHYSYARSSHAKEDALREAKGVEKLLLDLRAKGYFPKLPIAFDVEDNGDLKGGDHGDMARPNWAARTEMAYTFCEYLESKGFFVMVYASRSWFAQMGNLARFAVWLAEWNAKPSMANHLWQYTSKGDGAYYGTQGRHIDLNKTTLDFPKIIKEKGLNGLGLKDHIPGCANLCPMKKKKLQIVKKEDGYYLVDDEMLLVSNVKIEVNESGRLLLEGVTHR